MNCPASCCRPFVGLIVVRCLGFRDVEERSENLVHRDETGGHPGRGTQEPAPVHALAVSFRQLVDPLLDLLLLPGLRLWRELAVRDDPGRDGRFAVEFFGELELVDVHEIRHAFPPLTLPPCRWRIAGTATISAGRKTAPVVLFIYLRYIHLYANYDSVKHATVMVKDPLVRSTVALDNRGRGALFAERPIVD